jgi:hypothetical protein
MADRVAKIQQRSFACRLAFISGHNRRFDFDVAADKRRQLFAIEPLQPLKHFRIANDRMLNDFGEALPPFARRQGGQRLHIGDHEGRLMPGPEQVLACGRVDGGLSADGTIDLREQRSRHLHARNSPVINRSGKSGQVAYHSAAQGHHKR